MHPVGIKDLLFGFSYLKIKLSLMDHTDCLQQRRSCKSLSSPQADFASLVFPSPASSNPPVFRSHGKGLCYWSSQGTLPSLLPRHRQDLRCVLGWGPSIWTPKGSQWDLANINQTVTCEFHTHGISRTGLTHTDKNRSQASSQCSDQGNGLAPSSQVNAQV